MSMKENLKRWRKTPKGVLTNMYHAMKGRHDVSFTLAEFHEMWLGNSRFLRLHSEWLSSGCNKQKKPSIDRIDNKKNYTVENIHMLTWSENRYKQRMERRCRKGPVEMVLDGEAIKVFKSQRYAVIETGLLQGNISRALNNSRRTCGGYYWRYHHQNQELLEVKS